MKHLVKDGMVVMDCIATDMTDCRPDISEYDDQVKLFGGGVGGPM